jgi:hypothetical protein
MTASESADKAATVAMAPAVVISAPAPAAPERWCDVVGYEGSYQVSDMGRARSLDPVIHRGDGVSVVQRQLLTPFPYSGKAKRRYLCVRLIRDGVGETRPVHQPALEAFVGPRPQGTLGCHWDDDHENNDLSNLGGCTPLANAHDRARNCGLRHALAVIKTW